MHKIIDETFDFEGKSYTLRGIFTGAEILIQAYEGDRPVSPRVSSSIDAGLDEIGGLLPTARILAAWCKSFITEKTAAHYQEAMRQLRARPTK